MSEDDTKKKKVPKEPVPEEQIDGPPSPEKKKSRKKIAKRSKSDKTKSEPKHSQINSLADSDEEPEKTDDKKEHNKSSNYEVKLTPDSRKEKRLKLIQELLASERTHVDSLKTVVTDFYNPIKEILPSNTLKQLFGNFELVLGWNMQFLSQLRARHEESEDEEEHGKFYGDIMAQMLFILKQLYSQYSENYELAQVTYKECLKIREFEQFIQNHSQSKSKNNLLTALYLPIQRMIMYDSLLKDIIQLTPPNHPDYEDLVNSQKMVVSATNQAQRVLEKRRNVEIVLRIQSQINGVDIAEPHRKYVYEGDVQLVVAPKIIKERHLYLFNDILLIAKLKKKKYEVEYMYKLADISIDEVESDRSLFKLVVNPSQQPPPQNVNNGNQPNAPLNPQPLILRANTVTTITEYSILCDDKQSWIQILMATIKALGTTPHELNVLRDEDFTSDSSIDDSGQLEKLYTREFLIEKILTWSDMKSEVVMADIKKLATKLRLAPLSTTDTE